MRKPAVASSRVYKAWRKISPLARPLARRVATPHGEPIQYVPNVRLSPCQVASRRTMTSTWSLRALREAAVGACRAAEGLGMCSGVAIASAGAL
jgi:hypothetical protein